MSKYESSLAEPECQQLAAADLILVLHAKEFLDELLRFVDLSAERYRYGMTKVQWWWYLDIIAELPDYIIKQPEAELVLA